MAEYIFKADSADIEITHAYERWIFQHPQHLKLQQENGWITFYAINKKDIKVDAHIHVCVIDGKAVSPVKATFGSLQCSEKLELSVCFDFMEFVLNELKTMGVKQVVLKNPPDAYLDDRAPLQNTVFFNLGFQVETAEISTVLTIQEDFQSLISPWEKRKLRQSVSSDLTFNAVPLERLLDTYAFILMCREERNYKLAIDWETLQKTAQSFPDRFILFHITHEDKLVAASICIDVGNDVLYNFHSAHPREYDHLSPVVMLLQGIYNFAKERSYTKIDLGTSAVNDRPNFGLLDFKLSLGGKPSLKLTLSKVL